MKRWFWVAAMLAPCVGGCADESAPPNTGNTMASGTSPTTTNTTSAEDTGDDANTTAADDDPGTTTDTPDTTGGSDPPGDGSSGDPETSGGGLGSVRGAVIRTIEPAEGEDGIGDLYVGLLAECAQDAASVGDGDQIVGADLSAPGATVMYEILNVPDGTFYVVGFLDDDQNAADGMPDRDDIVTADGLGPGCVEVTVTGGNSVVAPSPVELNFLYPF